MFFEKPSIAPGTFSRGEAATLSEIYDAAYDSAIHVDNMNARQVSMSEAYSARIDAIERATGQRLENPLETTTRGARQIPTSPGRETEFEQRLADLAKQFPDKRDVIRPDFTPRMEARKTAAAAEGRLLDARSRTPGWSKYAVEFAGGFRASFEDPFQVATLGVGPWRNVGIGAGAVIMSALKQGAANAGVAAVMQPSVQSWRKEAGLDYGISQAAANVAMGFAFGAALDGGVRGLYRGGRNALGYKPTLDAAGGVNGYDKPPATPEDALETAIPNLPEGDLVRQAAAGDVAALKDLAKQTGADADPAVQGALRALDIEAGLDHRVTGVDDFEADQKLLQALRAADDPDEPAPTSSSPLPEARHASLADDAPAPLQAFKIEGKPVTFREVSPRDTITDAGTFQFKGGGDVAGATERLNGVQTWDPIAAGRAVVYERADGKLVIADGHQRDALAKRLIDQDPKLQAFVFREVDGWTPADVRALAAKKNLQEGSGTVIDAAKIMRERPDIIDRSVPLGSEAMRQARALARLSDDAFSDVAAGMAPANYAALVADLVEDKARHGSVLREVMQASPANVREARFMIGDILQAETVHETQLTLLGTEHVTRSLLPERAKVLDAAVKLLRDDARIFGLLTREQQRIEAAGNRLSAGNADQALQAAAVQEAIEQLAATRGKVSDWLSEAARASASGLPVKQTSEAFARRVRETLERDGIKGLAAEPETLRASGFDEPAGEDARLQIEDLERELGEEITVAMKPDVANARQAVLFSLIPGSQDGQQLFALRSSPYARTPAAERLRPEIQRELLKTVNMLPPDVKLRVMDRVVFQTGQEIQGLWDGADRLVYVSLAHGDPVRTARHETVHALRQSGLLSDQEFDTLYRAAEQLGLREAYGIDKSYRDIYSKAYGHRGDDYIEALLREEVIADMFADYSLNGRRFANEVPGGGAIDKIIDVIVQFMERLRNSLDGLGFRDVRDVFEAIETGEVARRGMRENVLPDGSKVWGLNLAALKAYHGTPHEFDKFSTSKIGDGEGAQAFGHGLYFAESEGVARGYQRRVPYQTLKREFQRDLPDDADFGEVMDLVGTGRFSAYQERVLKALQADDWLGFDYPSQAISAVYSGRIKEWDPSPALEQAIEQSGRLYEVRLNVEQEQLLDWDKPLSQQSAIIRGAFERYGISADEKGAHAYDLAGAQADPIPADDNGWTSIVNVVNDTTTARGRAMVADVLRDAGVPGIRYLDRSSRSKGDGSYNYVIFDDSKIEIVAINGEPVPALRAELADAERAGDMKDLAEVCKL